MISPSITENDEISVILGQPLTGEHEWMVLDVMGQIRLFGKINFNHSVLNIAVQDLESGVYTVIIPDQGLAGKFIKF